LEELCSITPKWTTCAEKVAIPWFIGDATISKNRPGKSSGVTQYDLSKCGFKITPDLVKRVGFERIECPKCGEKFAPASGRHIAN
jgi:hypothetical protein